MHLLPFTIIAVFGIIFGLIVIGKGGWNLVLGLILISAGALGLFSLLKILEVI